jgi:hypothetical protein
VDEVKYEPGALSASQLEAAIKEFEAEVAAGAEDIEADAEDADVSLVDAGAIEVRHEGAGLGGVGEAIVIAVVVEGGKALIEHVIVPWIKRRYGDNAVGRRKG